MLVDLLEVLVNAGFWAATIRIACPLLLATLGELMCERAGVLNLGIEGIMSIGAMVGWTAVYMGADLSVGVLAAALVGAAFGLLHAGFTVYLGASQHVTGIGITLFASSIGFFAFRLLLPSSTTPPAAPAATPAALHQHQAPCAKCTVCQCLGGSTEEVRPAPTLRAAQIP